MDRAALTCPDCGNELVHKVSDLYDVGLGGQRSTGGTVMPEGDLDGPGGFGSGSWMGRRRMASRFRPPRKPTRLSIALISVTLVFSFTVAPCFVCNYTSGKSPLEAGIAYALLALCLSSLAAYLYLSRWQKSHYRTETPRWFHSMRKWNRLYYCQRCDSVFDSETGEHVQARDMRRIL